MHMGRVRKFASEQAACGPPRAGAAAVAGATPLTGARAGAEPGAGSLRWLLLPGDVAPTDVLALTVPTDAWLGLSAELGNLAACAARLAAAEATDSGALAAATDAEVAAPGAETDNEAVAV